MPEKTKKQTVPTPPIPKPTTQKEMVPIEKGQLENILKRIEGLERDKDMLLKVADKRQLGIYYSRHQGKIPSNVMLRTYNGKVVLGWRSIKNIPPQRNPETGLWRAEVQTTQLMFEDGTDSGEIYQVDFETKYLPVPAVVKQRMVNEETGAVALKVERLDNAKE